MVPGLRGADTRDTNEESKRTVHRLWFKLCVHGCGTKGRAVAGVCSFVVNMRVSKLRTRKRGGRTEISRDGAVTVRATGAVVVVVDGKLLGLLDGLGDDGGDGERVHCLGCRRARVG